MHDDIEDAAMTGSRFAEKRIVVAEVDGGVAGVFVVDSLLRTGVN